MTKKKWKKKPKKISLHTYTEISIRTYKKSYVHTYIRTYLGWSNQKKFQFDAFQGGGLTLCSQSLITCYPAGQLAVKFLHQFLSFCAPAKLQQFRSSSQHICYNTLARLPISICSALLSTHLSLSLSLSLSLKHTIPRLHLDLFEQITVFGVLGIATIELNLFSLIELESQIDIVPEYLFVVALFQLSLFRSSSVCS